MQDKNKILDLLVYHNIILDLLRKERLNIPTHQTIDEFTHLAQLEVYENLYKTYGASQDIQDEFSIFKKSAPFSADTKGFTPYPKDYEHLITVYTISYNNTTKNSLRHTVQFVQEDKLGHALQNQIRKVSAEYPIATTTAAGIVLFPQLQQSGVIEYFRHPFAPKLVYTVNGRTIEYDNINSIQLEWHDPIVRKIMLRSLAYLGLNLNENQLIQFEQLKENGNS